MGRETSKCSARRLAQGHTQKLIGHGLDIGAGDDPFRPVAGTCRSWDQKHGHGDATNLIGIEANSLDYIYSSHCLEHLPDPTAALRRWIEVIKPQGFLYIVVPDFDLYEGGQKICNPFHKTSFSMHRLSDPSVPLFNILDIMRDFASMLKLWYVATCDDNYDYRLDRRIDQTRRGAVCHIEVLAEKCD